VDQGLLQQNPTLETFHEAGKDPDVLKVLNICVITGKMDGRIFFYKSQRHFIQTKSIRTYPINGNKNGQGKYRPEKNPYRAHR
jgi:hypothetical protein